MWFYSSLVLGTRIEPDEASFARPTFGVADLDMHVATMALSKPLIQDHARGRTLLFSGGAGLILFNPHENIFSAVPDADVPIEYETTVDPVVVLGGTLRWELTQRLALRSDLDTIIQYCVSGGPGEESRFLCHERSFVNHLTFSVGMEFVVPSP